MDKRGEGEQFNWIFVIVAGSILLAFFVIFTFKYIELQERRQHVDTVMFLGDSVLSASSKIQVGSGGAVIDSNEKDGLRFGYKVKLGNLCNGNDSLILINGGKEAYYKLDDEIVFMNKEMNIEALDIWILPWNFPFYITNFIYLADPQTEFNFVTDSFSNEFVENLDFSSAFKTRIVSGNNFDTTIKSKVIYFTSEIPSTSEVAKLNTKDVVYVDLKNSQAIFLEENKWSRPVKFYATKENNEQLIGAMFSNDAKNFDCNIRMSTERLKIVSRNYAKKARLLNQIERGKACQYNLISNSLFSLSQVEKDDDLISLVESLKNQNLQGGCLWVY